MHQTSPNPATRSEVANVVQFFAFAMVRSHAVDLKLFCKWLVSLFEVYIPIAGCGNTQWRSTILLNLL